SGRRRASRGTISRRRGLDGDGRKHDDRSPRFLADSRGPRIEQFARLRGPHRHTSDLLAGTGGAAPTQIPGARTRPDRLPRPRQLVASRPPAQLAHAVDWVRARSGPSPSGGGSRVYQVYALKCGERDTTACEFFYREPSHERITLDFFVWLIL